MADIAASDVTYTLQSADIQDKYRQNMFKVEFGDGALTYPAGGIPLDKSQLGMPNEIRALSFVDMEDAQGLLYKYDFENNKIRIYEEADSAGAMAELSGGADTPAATDLYVLALGW